MSLWELAYGISYTYEFKSIKVFQVCFKFLSILLVLFCMHVYEFYTILQLYFLRFYFPFYDFKYLECIATS